MTNFWQTPITIGNLKINRFMAAPLDGITDSPLRQLIRQFSPDEMLMTEMRHVACVSNEREGKTLRYEAMEQPLAFQFSANKTEFIAKAVDKVIDAGFIMINLNCGCPAPVVTKSGSGSALMANPEHLKMLLQYFSKTINGRVPFTIKIRAGYKQKNAVEIAKMAVDNGVESIMIHPRTQPEGFTSRLDYELTRKVKEAVNVPIIFSGNVNKFETAVRVHEMTGVDGFMIGRALWGAPWKLREITDAAQGKTFSVDLATVLKLALEHLNLNMKCFGPRGFIPFKKQLPQYIRGVADANEWRFKLLRTQTEPEMRLLMEQIIKENEAPCTHSSNACSL